MANSENDKSLSKNYIPLPGTERRPYSNASFIAPSDENEELTVTIVLRRRPDGQQLPDDMDKVVKYAEQSGLKIIETSLPARTVVVFGTVAQMNKAFGVSLGIYRHRIVREGENSKTETYRGRDGFVHVPEYLANIVTGVFGLDNRNITKTNAADPPGTAPLTVAQVAGLYNFPTNSAAGQTIGIVSVGGYQAADINGTFGGNPPVITEVPVNGRTNNGQADGETTQDICIAALAAPGAAIAVYFHDGSQQGWLSVFKKVAYPLNTDPHCSVISSSFYICDGDDANTLANEGVTTAFLTALSDAFQDATTQVPGVTICIATGDTGSSSKVGGNPAQWQMSFPADGKAHVQFPGSSPWVLAVGGTTIGNINGAAFDEYVWNDPAPGDPSNWGTTGGGISDFFALPSYQNGAGVPQSINDSHVGRGVPDVAGNASYNSGYSGIFVGGNPFIGNGTSASSPLWAGLIAVINAALGKNVGFLNPIIYSLGSGVFQDIVPGAGPADNSNSGIAGYPAGPGWDACTGWGSPNGVKLLNGIKAKLLVNQDIASAAVPVLVEASASEKT